MQSFAEILPMLMLPTLAVLLFTGFPVALVLAGTGLLFAGLAWIAGDFPTLAFFNFPLRLRGTLTRGFIYPAVPMLLFMGLAIEKSGVAREMLLCMRIILRRVPSSMSVGVILLGILLAPAAGLVGASVATLALVALPTMLEQGYKPQIATSAVAASGTLGIILPPGIMLFFLAQQLHVTMGSLFLGTIVPGLGLALLFIAYFVTRAALEGRTETPLAHDFTDRPGALAVYVFRSLALPVALIILVLGSIIAGWATPTEAGAVGAAGGVMLMALTRTLTPRRLNDVVKATVRTTAMVFFILVAATIFTYPFRYLGGDSLIHELLTSSGFNDWGILAVILVTIFILGFFIDWIEIIIITLPIFIPAIETLDFAGYVGSEEMAKVWIAILIALVLQTSFLTPPFGFALFFVKGAAPPEIRLAEIYRGAVPLVAIQLLGIALVAALPVMAVGLPTMALD